MRNNMTYTVKAAAVMFRCLPVGKKCGHENRLTFI